MAGTEISTLIYIDNISSGTPSGTAANITETGFYFFDGSLWQKLSVGNAANIYNTNGSVLSNRTVDLSDKTLSFNSTATAGTSHFKVDGNTFNINTISNSVGIGTDAPTHNLEANGTVAFPTVATTAVPGPYSGLGINSTTGQIGIYTPGASPVFYLRSTYNSYATAAVNNFELTNGATVLINTLGATVQNGGSDGASNTDYIVLPQAGIYRIDANFSYAATDGLGATILDIFGTSNAAPSTTYTNLFSSYIQTPATGNTQGVTAFAIFEVAEASRIRISLRHSTYNVNIRRPAVPNPPTTTLNFVITKL